MKLLYLLLLLPSLAFAETKVTGNEISTASLRGTWQQTTSVTLTAASTTTINGLKSNTHYKIFYHLTQNTSAGELRMLINSKTSGYYWGTFGHNSSAANGTIGAAGTGTYWPLAYNGTTTPATHDTHGEWTLYCNPSTQLVKLHGKGIRYTGSYVEMAHTFGDFSGGIGATTFPISIYTSGGTLTGTIYIQEFIP